MNCKENQKNYFKIDFKYSFVYVTFDNYGYYILKYDKQSLCFLMNLDDNLEGFEFASFFN